MNKLILPILLIVMLHSCTKIQKQDASKTQNKAWWKEGVLYQIYPQSFKDTNGDGFGDFRGVIEKLDYLESLGITMVWMNPFFESPMVDNGYDVSDYRAILPRYGTMEDFQEMFDVAMAPGGRFVISLIQKK